MEPATIILALCIPLAFGVGWRVGSASSNTENERLCRADREVYESAYISAHLRLVDYEMTEAKRHTQRMAALAKANAANRAKRDAS